MARTTAKIQTGRTSQRYRKVSLCPTAFVTASLQVVIDALPEGILPADFDLEEVNIEEALSAVSETLGSLGDSGIDISQLGDLASQLGGVLGNSDGSGFDFSQFGGGSGFDISKFGGGATAGYKGRVWGASTLKLDTYDIKYPHKCKVFQW